MRSALSILSLALFACGPTQSSGGTPDAGGDPGPVDAGGDPCTSAGVQTVLSLQIEPASVSLAKGNSARLAVTATMANGCQVDVTSSAYYSATDARVAKVVLAPADPNSPVPGRMVQGVSAGTTTVFASTGPSKTGVVSAALEVTVTDSAVVPVAQETRALWVTRYALTSEREVKALVDRAAAAGFNTLFVQVRGAGDAYYRSTLAPWWKLSADGKLGADPGWDPLATAVQEGHAKGLKVHAYLNAMSGWSKGGGTAPRAIPDSVAGAPKHILLQHPEYTCLDANGADSAPEYTFLAAEPGYRTHLADVAEEILRGYQVDGIHLDRIRTPGPKFCHSPAFDQAYAAQYGTDQTHFAEFQRAQIDAAVNEVYQRLLAVRPAAMLSAAVWGIYKRLPGCNTSQGFADYHQDSLGWMQKGIIDALAPMIYWDLKPGACTDFAALLDSFAAGANGRQVIGGMNALDGSPAAPDFPRVAARIDYARQKKVAGTAIFASAYLDQYSMWTEFKAGPYAQDAAPAAISFR